MFIDKSFNSFIYYTAYFISNSSLYYCSRLVLLLIKKLRNFVIRTSIKTDNFFIILNFFQLNTEREKMTTMLKYFMFGKYSALVSERRGCCMHVFLVFYLKE